MTRKNKEYNASSIKALDQRTHLIKRMSLTFGAEGGTPADPFSTQKSVAIREITDNSIDEVIGGYADRVKVSFFEDGSVEVQDNGRGIPVDIGQDSSGKPASGIYLSLGVIQSGGKFELDSERFSGGLNGVGSSSTIATSKRADVTVFRDKHKYTLSFKDGKPGFFDGEGPEAKFTELTDLTVVKKEKDTRTAQEKKTWKTGTIVKVWLDDAVYTSTYGINRLDITERLRGSVFLIPGLTIDVYNEIDKVEIDGKEVPREDTFNFENGIEELVTLNQNRDPLSEIIHLEARESYKEIAPVLQPDGKSVVNQEVDRVVIVEVAMGWDIGYDYNIESYVNTIRTRLGGVHEAAFERALVRSFTEKISSMRGMLPATMKLKPNFEDFAEGLTVVLSVKISEPQFTGQAKEELGGREAQRAIQNILGKLFDEWVNAGRNFEQMKLIGKKISDATKAREAEKEARDVKRQKNKLESSGSLPVKLVDCEVTHTDDSELYIVEGDSAKGALKAARYSSHQALLPIRGKIINTKKHTLQKVLANAEVQDIIRCMDAGVGADFDIDKLRYGRVFFATDADVDGGAISVLLMMLYWDLFRPMVEEGRVYQLLTPLYLIQPRRRGAGNLYALNDIEFDEITRELDKDGVRYDVKRLKGLGEAGAKVLNETAMNPETRTVKQITIRDMEAAADMLEITLGKEVEPRKDWIERNPYDQSQNLD